MICKDGFKRLKSKYLVKFDIADLYNLIDMNTRMSSQPQNNAHCSDMD